MFSIKRKPTKPHRLSQQRGIQLNGQTLQELLDDCSSQGYTPENVSIWWDYDEEGNEIITFYATEWESEVDYEKRLNQYEAKLRKYESWYNEYEDAILAELERREVVREEKRLQKQNARKAQIKDTIRKLERELSK